MGRLPTPHTDLTKLRTLTDALKARVGVLPLTLAIARAGPVIPRVLHDRAELLELIAVATGQPATPADEQLVAAILEEVARLSASSPQAELAPEAWADDVKGHVQQRVTARVQAQRGADAKAKREREKLRAAAKAAKPRRTPSRLGLPSKGRRL